MKSLMWRRLEERLLDHIGVLESNLLSEKKKNIALVQINDSFISQCSCLSQRKHANNRDDMFPRCTSLNQEDDQIDKLRIALTYVNNDNNDRHVKEKPIEETSTEDRSEDNYIQKPQNCSRPCRSNETESLTPTSDTRKGYSPFRPRKKCHVSGWIQTRSHPNWCGPGPHDDFLDTPFQNIKVNMNKASTEEAVGLHVNVSKEINTYCNHETPQECMDLHPYKQPMTTVYDGSRKLKHVAVVRKKADRDNLKGIECRQCKKFNDVVLPDTDDKRGSSKSHVRSEHHHGVSRHMYNYVPPMTPDGFWNIGFES